MRMIAIHIDRVDTDALASGVKTGLNALRFLSALQFPPHAMELNALGIADNNNNRDRNHQPADTPGQAWTRTWINRLDETSSSMCPSSQASTPLQSSNMNDQAGGLASPSQSSDSLSDEEITDHDEWKISEDVKWKNDDGIPADVSEDVTRSLPTELLLQVCHHSDL